VAYFNFTKIAPPAPNDPNVNEVTQLNDNWDHLDSKLSPYMSGGALTGLETGQEVFASGFRFAVYDGSGVRSPDDIDAAWSAWTNLPMFAPRVIRAGFTPRWRNNSLLRMVELSGGVLFNAAADPWTMGALLTINADSAGAIPASMAPIGGSSRSPAATSLTAGTSVVSGAFCIIDKPGGNTFCRIQAQFMGGPGGGNFLMLDQVMWWY
jgi:hypothetical protein